MESDGLFFAYSEKGNRHLDREPKKRGEKAGKAGISDEKVAVVATCDRSGNKDFKVATRGRTGKKDLDRVLKGKLDRSDVLRSDDHGSYGGFARAKAIDHERSKCFQRTKNCGQSLSSLHIVKVMKNYRSKRCGIQNV